MATAACLCLGFAPSVSKIMKQVHLIFIFLHLLSLVCQAVEVTRPRGVALTKKVFYDPAQDFTCLDGSATIPFPYVNDDYCDCADGTDEPGTAACPNGFFHCTNAGHKPLNIPSSRVNDGICDCCDASDEYNSSANCVNHCKELGRRAREEAQRMMDLLAKGFEKKQEYSQQGKQQKESRKGKLSELEAEKDQNAAVKSEKEGLKASAEELEKVALDKYRDEEEERKKQEEAVRLEEERVKEATDAFMDLDEDKDGKLTIAEVQARWVFDQDKDGQVSVEEAKFFLLNKPEIDLDEFKRTGWLMMKPHYSLQKMFKGPEDIAATAQPDSEQVEEPKELPVAPSPDSVIDQPYHVGDPHDPSTDTEEDGAGGDDDDEDEDDEDEDLMDPTKFPAPESEGKENEKPVEDASPQYDEETQRLIDAANTARSEFEDAERKVRDVENEIEKLKKVMEIDFGPDDEFSPLHGECFEFTDREYIYKLCPFEQSSQRQKSGGSETSLGHWGQWTGPDENKYSKMKYENGVTCWNGPARSTEVRLQCGMENQVILVAEPNRCEYVFDFTTPAVCNQLPKDSGTGHDEL